MFTRNYWYSETPGKKYINTRVLARSFFSLYYCINVFAVALPHEEASISLIEAFSLSA